MLDEYEYKNINSTYISKLGKHDNTQQVWKLSENFTKIAVHSNNFEITDEFKNESNVRHF